MAGTTTNFAIPYPQSTDFVTDGATAIQALADTVDGVLSSGTPARNLLINGAIQVAQRSTSSAGITTANYYTADRYNTNITTLGTLTQSVENDAPTGSGFRKSLKNLVTTANASPAVGALLQTAQYIEGQNLQAIRKGTASAQTITLSFYVKANVTGTYIAELFDVDNTRQCSKAYTIAVANTWEEKTLVFPADVTGAFDNDNSSSLQVNLWQGAGTTFTSGTLNTVWGTSVNANRAVGQVNLAAATSNFWQVTGAQLTIGSVSVPFEFKSFADDLRDCQRYYWRTFGTGTSSDIVGSGSTNNANNVYIGIPHPVTMRAKATSVEFVGRVTEFNSDHIPTSFAIGQGNVQSTSVQFNKTSAFTAYIPYFVNLQATTAFIACSAEL